MIPILDAFPNMINFHSLKICVSTDGIFSGNTMYEAITRGKGYGHASIIKSDKCRVYQSAVSDQVSELPEWIIEAAVACKIIGNLSMTESMWFAKSSKKLRRIDITNAWKPLEDALFRSLGLDDSIVCDCRLVKSLMTDDDLRSSDTGFQFLCDIDLYSFDTKLDKVRKKYHL